MRRFEVRFIAKIKFPKVSKRKAKQKSAWHRNERNLRGMATKIAHGRVFLL